MKRTITAALLLGAVSGFGLVGCSDTTTESSKVEVKGPDGTHEIETKTTDKVTGNPPPVEGAKTPTP